MSVVTTVVLPPRKRCIGRFTPPAAGPDDLHLEETVRPSPVQRSRKNCPSEDETVLVKVGDVHPCQNNREVSAVGDLRTLRALNEMIGLQVGKVLDAERLCENSPNDLNDGMISAFVVEAF
ncbi:hypothetical protein, partial [uncultured Roseobacter sp.]|uniref:hypothetical protein n=1 Tax=uncultured Roseobacter sp. TaxID=114847 RepID=UPI0026330AF1